MTTAWVFIELMPLIYMEDRYEFIIYLFAQSMA